MNTTEIRKLLDKYYRGDSSEDEELILRRFFEAKNVPSGFEEEKEIFRFFSENAKVPEPSEDFEKNIISAVDSSESRNLVPVNRSRVLTYSGIAACLLLILGIYFFFINNSKPKDTFSDPEIAYSETVKILYEVSSTFNHGTQQLDQLRKIEAVAARGISTINKSTGIIDNSLKNLDYFQQAINIVSSPMDIVKNK